MGALIGAAIGAVFWALVGILGYMASIVGFIIAYLADKGYDLLNGRQGTIKMVVRIVCVFLAVGNGTLGSYVWMIHDNYTYQYNALSEVEKKYGDTKSEYMVELLSERDLQGCMLKDGAMGLVFVVLGSFVLIAAVKGNKQEAAPSAASADELPPSEQADQDNNA